MNVMRDLGKGFIPVHRTPEIMSWGHEGTTEPGFSSLECLGLEVPKRSVWCY